MGYVHANVTVVYDACVLMTSKVLGGAAVLLACVAAATRAEDAAVNPFLEVMQKAWAHAKAHGAVQPVLSPVDATVLSGAVPVKELQAQGFRIVPWTTNEPEKMRQMI